MVIFRELSFNSLVSFTTIIKYLYYFDRYEIIMYSRYEYCMGACWKCWNII